MKKPRLFTALAVATLMIPMLFANKTTSFAAENGDAPSVSLSSSFVPANRGWNTTSFTISLNGGTLNSLSTGGTKAYQYRLSGDTKWTNLSSDEVIWNTDTTKETFYVRCYDTKDATNYSATTSFDFQYDGTKPSVSAKLSTTKENTIVASASDKTSGVVYYGLSTSVTKEPTTWQSDENLTYDTADNYYVWAKDAAGNTAVTSNTVTGTISLATCNVSISNTSYVYSGNANKPAVSVTYKGKALIENTDYTVAYSNNTNAGTGTVTIKGQTLYSDTVTREFTIEKATTTTDLPDKVTLVVGQDKKLTSSILTGTGSLTYTSLDEKIAKVSSGTISGEKTGKVNIIVTNAGNNNYTSYTKTITVNVKPKAQKILSVKSLKKKQMTVTWKKNTSGVTGYKVYVSTNKHFTDKTTKVYTVKGKNKTSKTIKKLKAGKKYYVKVVAYKTSGGEDVLSTASSVKTVKVLKK